MRLTKVSLREKFDALTDAWAPRTIAEANEFAVKIVKLDGDFIWHHHEVEDEIFVVLCGRIDMHYRDGDGTERVEPFGGGELLAVPHGVEHKPVAVPGTEIMLIERRETVNTGNVADSDRRREARSL